jgi:hypothetical protein
MFPKTIALLFLLAFVTRARADINFTPSLKEYVSEGINYQSLTFKDDKRTISIELPLHWTYRGDAGRLQLMPNGKNFAEGLIQAVRLAGPQPINEAVEKALEAQVIAALPAGSQSVAVVKREENAVILDHNLGYEIIVSYQTLGQAFLRSVIFVNCPDKRLIFRFTAPKADFDSLNKAFRHSIYSWEWAEAQPNAAQVAAAETSTPRK